MSLSLHDTINDQQNSDEDSNGGDAGASSTNDIPIDTSGVADLPDIKPKLVPIYEVHKANSEDIREQLEVTAVEIIDDMEIIVTSKGFGKPLNATAEGLIKQEKPDGVSGDIPFIVTVN